MFNFFDKLKTTVSKTAQALVGNVVETVSSEEEFSDFILDDMEALLILRDASPDVANPMNTEVCVSLTSLVEEDEMDINSIPSYESDEDDYDED